MKQSFIIYLFILIFTIPVVACAQQTGYDTTNTRVYEVKKKKEKVSDIAKKLQVDPAIISELNNFASIDATLTRGQKIIVPVLPDADKIKEGDKTDGKGKDEATPRKSRQTVTVSLSPPPPLPAPAPPPVDTELLQSKIMLLDATLDLNQTLLQGIKASLDSFNVKDKGVVDEKNMQATIRGMERRRDKALLTPYLLHMQDSLNTEITNEQNEKAKLEYALSGIQPKTLLHDTASQTNMAKNDTATGVPDIDHRPYISDRDTITPQMMPDTIHRRRVIETGSSSQPSASTPQVMHWETARAIYENDDTLPGANNETEPAPADAQLVQNSHDTSAYIPPATEVNTSSQPVMSDSVRVLKARLYLTRAMKASNEKNYKAAVASLRKSIDLMPRYYDAWFDLGEADTHLGLYTKALNEFKTCQAIDSSQAPLFYKMGSLDLKLDKKDEAADCFNKSLVLDSGYVPAIMGRGLIFAGRKDYKAAINEYARALNIDHGYHTAYKAKAMAEYSLKSYKAAIDDFTRFMIFDDTDGSTYYYRGMSRISLRQKADACADFSFADKMGYRPASKALAEYCQ